ncbi:MAG: response regulator receiver protein [Frankiales bacterium]|nr:response regulator receiver protein [Frankiales bacterium]
MKVVSADDSPTLRKIVSTVLSKEGYEVIAVEDGLQAVQAVFREMPDAIVLDVQMPRISGYVAARVLKDDWQTKEIPIILLTSLDAASDRYWGKQVGADQYLSKDFEAPDLVLAVSQVLEAAKAKAGGRVVKADPVDLSDDDVLQRVCEILDRKLFEASVQGEIIALAAESASLEDSIAKLLEVLGRFLDYDLAMVLLHEEKVGYVGVGKECSGLEYDQFLDAAAESMSQLTGMPYPADMLDARVADPDELLDDEDDTTEMATYLSMPLHGRGGKVVGLLGLCSSVKNAFGETQLATLKLIEGPAAVVLDNALLAAK